MIKKKYAKTKKKLTKEQRVLAKDTFFSFLQAYSVFFFTLITSFFIARMINREVWAFLILAQSFITIFSSFLLFLPTGMGPSINYYVPKYKAENKMDKLRSFIKYSIAIRSIFVFPVFLLSLVIFTQFIWFFMLSLKEYTYIFYILAPLIIINGLDKTFQNISRSLHYFKLVLILVFIKFAFNIGALIYFFFFIENVNIDSIAYIMLYSSFIPFIINCIFMVFIIKFKVKTTEEGEGLGFKETLSKLYKYGIHLSLKDFILSFHKEIRTQAIRFFESTETVTGWNIGSHYQSIANQAPSSINVPLTISLSHLYSLKEERQIEKIYNVFFIYSIFLVILISGFLFFLSEFFLFVIYGQDYLEYTIILQLLLLSIVFNVIDSFFFSLMRASNKVK